MIHTSSYSELIKNFEKTRAYIRDFYVYGFKSREEYDRKSARSYDDERRRVESWLGDHMGFVRTPEGTIEIDPTGKKNGRGAYMKLDVEVIALAEKKKILNRVFETEVPAQIYEDLRQLIR